MLNPTRRILASCLGRTLALGGLHGAQGAQRYMLCVSEAQSLRIRDTTASDSWCKAGGSSSRIFSSGAEDYQDEVEDINKLFAEGRDEIEYAREDSETTYFNESVEGAKKVVDSCIEKWDALLNRLPESERGKLQRSMGLKMEQLKAEFDELRKMHS